MAYTPTNSEAATLVAAMSTPPDDTRYELIDDTVGSLKSAGLWAKLDCIYFTRAHHEQASRLNWINPAIHVLDKTLMDSATYFVVDSGWHGAVLRGVSAPRLRSNFHVGGSQHAQQDSMSLFAWVSRFGAAGNGNATAVGITRTNGVPVAGSYGTQVGASEVNVYGEPPIPTLIRTDHKISGGLNPPV